MYYRMTIIFFFIPISIIIFDNTREESETAMVEVIFKLRQGFMQPLSWIQKTRL